MKVKFACDNGANAQSERTDTFDTVTDLGYEEGEWEKLDEDAKYEAVRDWAMERFDYWFEELA